MRKPPKWFERKFSFDYPVTLFPNVVERLRGAPIRVEELIVGLDDDRLGRRDGNEWSLKEHIGHLADLEPLWDGRVDDLIGGDPIRPADLENRKTHEAGHGGTAIAALLQTFRDVRAAFVARLDALDDDGPALSGTHPRLEQPMRMIDLATFVAEHDDHHLALMREMRTRRFD